MIRRVLFVKLDMLSKVSPEYHQMLARGKRLSCVAAISVNGVLAADFTQDSMIADFFHEFARGSLIPNMLPFDGHNPKSVVIMNNCSIFHVDYMMQVFYSYFYHLIAQLSTQYYLVHFYLARSKTVLSTCATVGMDNILMKPLNQLDHNSCLQQSAEYYNIQKEIKFSVLLVLVLQLSLRYHILHACMD